MWMGKKRAQITKFEDTIKKDTGMFWKQARAWNWKHAPEAAAKDAKAADASWDSSKAPTVATYQLARMKADGSGAELKNDGTEFKEERPERPFPPKVPVAYAGPVLCTDATITNCLAGTLQH